jgi:acyl carrier protein
MQDELEKLAAIIRDLFDDYEGPITRDLSARDVTQWDSLTNVQFIVRVEREFGVRFLAREVGQFKNIGELLDMAARKREKQ